jgi:peroxiredoxin
MLTRITRKGICMFARKSPLFIALFLFVTAFFCKAELICAKDNDSTFAAASFPAAKELNLKTFKGENLLLFVYTLEDRRTNEAVGLMNELYRIRKEYNFDIVGVCLDEDKPSDVVAYRTNQNIAFPIYIDISREFSSKLKPQTVLGIYMYDKEGKLLASKTSEHTSQKTPLARAWKIFLRPYLKLEYIPEDDPVLGIKPNIPLFEVNTLTNKKINIKDLYTKKPVIVVVFSPKCSRCQDELAFLNTLYATGELKGLFEILALSRMDIQTTSSFVRNQSYTFPVAVDVQDICSSLFPSFAGSVPFSYVVDRQGRINSLHRGFTESMKDIYIMELKKLCGLPNKPLLNQKGFSGRAKCAICHEKEDIQWTLSAHAGAFQSLVRKGSADDKNCIACHVTGYGRDGGYSDADKKNSSHLEAVQCEVCHGPGGESCSAFTGKKTEEKSLDAWKALCLNCHTEKQSLNFDFSKRFSKIIHANASDLTKMDRNERLKLMRTYGEKNNLFDNQARYVGAESCKSCHIKEYEQWQTTKHAMADTTDKARQSSPEKLYRYNTGVDNPGGYPESGRQGVQCEACHGPGENHIKNPQGKGHNFIVSLGKECGNCVVEQICRKCHATEDDQEFDFETTIDTVRHKTVQ